MSRGLSQRIQFVVCVMLLMVVHSLSAAAAERAGRVLSVSGSVTIRGGQSDAARPARSGDTLLPGDTLVTGPYGRAKVLLADETLLHINRNTTFTLKQVSPSAGWFRLRALIPAAARVLESVYEIISGEVWIRNKNKDVRIDVETPYVTAGIRGTEFNVRVVPGQDVRVTVIEGELLAFNAFGSVSAAAGAEIVARPGAAPITRLLVAPGDTVQWTLTVPELFTFRDYPLVSGDRAVLGAELAGLPVTVASAVRRGLLLRDLGEPQAAENVLRERIAAAPDDRAAFTALGWALLDQGRAAEALDAFTRSDAGDRRAVIGTVATHIALAEPAAAAAVLEAGEQRGVSGLAVARAYIELLSGRPPGARAVLENWLAAAPDDALGWRLLALTRIVLGERSAALEAIDNAIGLNPASPSSALIQSAAFQAQYDLASAENAAREALSLDAEYLPALLALARLRFAAGDLPAARNILRRAEAVDSQSPELRNLKGFVLLAMREVDDAMAEFRDASLSAPDLSEPRLGMALAHMRQGRVVDALEEITTAVALQPQRAMLVSYWGKMLYQIERFDQALDVLDHAQRLDPRDPTPVFYKALIMRDLNRPAEAIALLHEAIALNDNRGVYRSRSLLDQDLAVRNVNLSGLYEDFEFNAWAQSKAIASTKEDYRNYEAHLFNAGTLQEREGRDYPFASEALLARLLQPANVNTFNSFNEYTALFETPSRDARVELALGSEETVNGEVSVFGAVPTADFAYDIGAFYENTEGWRETNFERSASVAAIAKWQPTLQDGVLLTASTLHAEAGDEAYPRFEIDSIADPDDAREDELTRLELGYRRNLSLSSDVLAVFSAVDTTGDLDEHTTISPFDDPTFTVEEFEETTIERPYYSIQLQYMRRFPEHQLITGGLVYRGEFNADSTTRSFVQRDGELIGPVVAETSGDEDIGFDSVYVQDIWSYSDSLVLEAALYAERLDNANPFTATSWRIEEINPRLGLIWEATASDTLRLAAFRYVLPFIAPRVDPTDVAGIWIYRNTEEGALVSEADVAWEHEWDRGFWSLTAFALEKEFTDRTVVNGDTPLRTRDGTLTGAEFELNQLLTQTLGWNGLYRYAVVEDDLLPQADREDQLLSVGLRHVRPSGLSMGIRQIFRHIDFDNERDEEAIAITDLELAYELPAKKGELKVEARNVFDEAFNWVTDNFVFSGRNPTREILLTYTGNF